MIIVCFTCNITLPHRRGSRPDGARLIIYLFNKYTIVVITTNLFIFLFKKHTKLSHYVNNYQYAYMDESSNQNT